MMTGEFEYDEMYQNYKSVHDTTDSHINSTDSNDNQPNATDTLNDHMNSTRASLMHGAFHAFRSLKLLIFIVFLILLPVAFYNLVTGIVVDKIKVKCRLSLTPHLRLVSLNYVGNCFIRAWRNNSKCTKYSTIFA